jgi:hypothetical protein
VLVVGEWGLRRALIDWDWCASGLWFDNRAYAHDQRLLLDGTIGGPSKEDLDAASGELARITEATRAELKRWNLLGEDLLGVSPPPHAEVLLPAFYAEKHRLAELVAKELGSDWIVSWSNADGVEHECIADIVRLTSPIDPTAGEAAVPIRGPVGRRAHRT